MALRPTAAWLNTLALLELELELDSAALNGLVTLFAPLDVDLAGNNAGEHWKLPLFVFPLVQKYCLRTQERALIIRERTFNMLGHLRTNTVMFIMTILIG